MVDVVVAGATGKLGSLVCKLMAGRRDMRLVGAVVSAEGGNVGREIAPGVRAVGPDGLENALEQADVFVDLTVADVAMADLRRAIPAGVNCVVGSTGLSDAFLCELDEMAAAAGSSVVQTFNFSVGVNIFWKTCVDLAIKLPEYEIEIIELHHDKKKDAPSGTALKAAQLMAQATGVNKFVHGREGMVGARGREIGIHAVRIGDVVGEHTVIFAGNKERLELTHRAHSREAFAEGCIQAILWVAERKDGRVHGMAEVLGI
ncbi:MAG TPA: 4-hydroxy-tetrahydrodipicolinate reductase [Methanomassiliicoccales archaeon]|nr:4-hydroxy-tetrahydrodipicolinate reductase [Methanomassiliicoccales archaeon]